MREKLRELRRGRAGAIPTLNPRSGSGEIPPAAAGNAAGARPGSPVCWDTAKPRWDLLLLGHSPCATWLLGAEGTADPKREV